MIDYSIIIPHKNTPGLLQYCLDSIPVRDDVQVIVVDDNSDTDKVDFEHFPQWKGDNYEYYLTKDGKGAGYARNVALEHAWGKWVLFVDADDFLLPSVGEIFDEEKDTDADIVFFRPKAVMLEDLKTFSSRADYFNNLIDIYFEKGDETPLRCMFESPCSKFVRLYMIQNNKLRFDEVRYGNDVVFMVSAGVLAKKVEVRDKSFYCITESGGSLTSNYMCKPGELRIRCDGIFRAQMIVYEKGYPINEKRVLYWLKKLFHEDREAFIVNFKRMLKMGYKRRWLLNELFKEHGRVSRLKRSFYVLVKTL